MKILREFLTILLILVCLSHSAKTQKGEFKNSTGILTSGGYYNSFYLKDRYNYLGRGKTACLGITYSRLISEDFYFVSGIRLIKTIDKIKVVCPYCDLFGEYTEVNLISLPFIIKYRIIAGIYISAGFDYHFPPGSIKNIIHSGNKLRSLDRHTRLGFDLSIGKDIRLTERIFISLEPQLILLSFSDYLFDDNQLFEENYVGLNLVLYRKFNFIKGTE